MAIPASDPWYRAEVVTDELEWFMYALADAFGAPRAAVGIRGNPATHFRGGHRSRAFILRSPYCTNRVYTVSRTEGDRTGGTGNEVAAGDLTLNHAGMKRLCQALDRAVRSGRFEELTEWFGQLDDDDQVEGYDNIANRLATSDPSHLWHAHMTFRRDVLRNRPFFERLLAFLIGDDMFTDEDRQRDINTNGRVAVVYPIAAGIARLEAVAGVLVKLAGEDAERDAAEAKLDAERHAEEMQLDAERHAEMAVQVAALLAGQAEILDEMRTTDPNDPEAVERLFARARVVLVPAPVPGPE